MTIAFDAKSNGGSGSVNEFWTHTPVGSPAGVLVFVERNTNSNPVTGITYGGVALAQIVGAESIKGAVEKSMVDAWFLGTGISTGAQTISITNSSAVYGQAYTVTATGDVEVNSVANYKADAEVSPIQKTLTLAGIVSFVAQCFVSGRGATTNVAPLTNWTNNKEVDSGSMIMASYSYDNIGSSDVTYGLTADATDDINIVAVSLMEEIIAASTPPKYMRRHSGFV